MGALTTTSDGIDASPVYELEFSLTADDVADLGEHLASVGEFHLAQMRHARRLLVALLLTASALLALLERDLASTLIFLVPLAVLSAVVWFSWPSRYQRLARKQALQLAQAETGTILGVRRYRVDTQGVAFSALASGGYVLWPAVTRVTSSDSAVYLHVSQAAAHIFPRRAFASDAHADAFAAQAAFWQRAGSAQWRRG